MAPKKKVTIAVVYQGGYPMQEVADEVRKNVYFARCILVGSGSLDYDDPNSPNAYHKAISRIAYADFCVLVLPTRWSKYTKSSSERAVFTRLMYEVLLRFPYAMVTLSVFTLLATGQYKYRDKEQIQGAAQAVGVSIHSGNRSGLIDYLGTLARSAR